MIRALARRFYEANRRYADKGELVQAGMVGMMKGIARFDPERGQKLSTYCMWWVRCEMHQYIKSVRWPWGVSDGNYKDVITFNRAMASVTPTFDQPRDLFEVDLHVQGKKLSRQTISAGIIFSSLTVSLDTPVTRDGKLTLYETIDDRQMLTAEDVTARHRISGLIEQALEKELTPEERDLVREYFFDGDAVAVLPDDPKKVSDAQRYIRNKALKKLAKSELMRRALEHLSAAEEIRTTRNRGRAR